MIESYCSHRDCWYLRVPGSSYCRFHTPYTPPTSRHPPTEAELVAYLNRVYGLNLDHLPTLEELRKASVPYVPGEE